MEAVSISFCLKWLKACQLSAEVYDKLRQMCEVLRVCDKQVESLKIRGEEISANSFVTISVSRVPMINNFQQFIKVFFPCATALLLFFTRDLETFKSSRHV